MQMTDPAYNGLLARVTKPERQNRFWKLAQGFHGHPPIACPARRCRIELTFATSRDGEECKSMRAPTIDWMRTQSVRTDALVVVISTVAGD